MSRDLELSQLSPILPGRLRFQVVSDLHIETICGHRSLTRDEIEDRINAIIVPSAPFLILAGDIGCPGSLPGEEHYRWFLGLQSSRFQAVFLIAGNHEYYSEISGVTGTYLTAPEIHQLIKSIADSFPNVYYLDRKAVLIDDLRIIGATLWSDIHSEREAQVEACVADYRRIHVPMYPGSKFPSSRPVTVKDTRIWHRYDLKYLRRQVKIAEANNQDVLVVTHHAPVHDGTSHPSHAGSALMSAFSNDLRALLADSPAIKLWVFGHTHHCCDMVVHDTRVYANQHGYCNDRESDYRNDTYVEI
ncbi:hypothetical protein PBRA_005535 [Plasmodiophora brassicae]|nr:hypothetical protein PBRA_005535 [Plasmodiophora brassicae]